jgi:hypothetical protein|tara:strand:+ start:230 stop:745 length:516 start_codon:yes stop_codon:yes gene_type:complete
MDDIKMKRFYGKHLHKYTGDVQPFATKNEYGQKGFFAALQMTNFSQTRTGWEKGLETNGGMKAQKRRSESTGMDQYESIKLRNQALGTKLSQIERKIATGDFQTEEVPQEQDHIYDRLGQRLMHRSNKMKQMYAAPKVHNPKEIDEMEVARLTATQMSNSVRVREHNASCR